MIFVRALTVEEQKALRRGVRREVGRVAERMRMILLSARGFAVPQIALIFECDEATIRRWIDRFNTEGMAGLYDLPRAGRPPRADAAAREQIRREVEQGPASEAQPGYWTSLSLGLHVGLTLGLELSRRTLRRLLHELGFVWRRPKHVLPSDPEAGAKMRSLTERLLRASAEAVVLCLDECDLHRLPVLRAMWMRRGSQVKVPTPGYNQKRGIFGALDLCSGRWHYRVTLRKRTEEFIAFLEQLLEAYPGEVPLLLVLDNASIHHSKALLQWLERVPRIELLYLPSYAGHRENPVEKVWWRMKDQIAANRLSDSIDTLVAAAEGFFSTFTSDDALRLAA